MKRREFLKNAGCFVASAGLSSIAGTLGCGSDDGDEGEGRHRFAQGVASGDPRPSSVMLWTRVSGAEGDAQGSVKLTLEVARKRDFAELVIAQALTVTAASDHTARVLVEDLDEDQIYFYRFRAGADLSRVGRTRTAPKPDADVEVRFAWVSCQDYASNYYGAYRQLLNDDADAPESEQLRFVLHVGDFIYETRGAGFMQSVDDDLSPIVLENADGEPRVVPEFPSGGGLTSDGVNFARTLDDYRHLYKRYLEDADLQDARARWPFVCVWDDHEFTNDCWQTQANYEDDSGTDEPSQARRLAASQAWFEFVPAILSDAADDADVPAQAKDFEALGVPLEDVPYDDVVEVAEPNNRAAISAVTIYRRLRFGKHVDLVLTDSRSYRSDHALAEEIGKNDVLIFHPRAALPKEVVNVMDAGRSAQGGAAPDEVGGFVNSRRDQEPGTMLGTAQKAWWKATMLASTATFKVWGNPVPLLRILLDASDVELIPNDLLLSPDAWDGYPSERKELMGFLRDNEIANVVSLSGDHHANYAGVVLDDYDAVDPKPVMVDLVTAAISSNSQFVEVGAALDSAVPPDLAPFVAPVKRVITYDSTPFGGTDKAVPNLNTLIRYGSRAANVAADSHDRAKIEAARDPAINAHLRYADARSLGYGLAVAGADALHATFVKVARSFEPLGEQSPGIVCTAGFRVPRVDSVAQTLLPEPQIQGEPPFPLV